MSPVSSTRVPEPDGITAPVNEKAKTVAEADREKLEKKFSKKEKLN